MRKECRTAREFGDIFRAEVKRLGGGGWGWRKELSPWLGSVFAGARFGDDRFDWSPDAARELAEAFVEEASTW